MTKNTSGFRPFLPLTFLIGFGFFTMGMMDPLYDSYVQIFLARYIDLKWQIGIIMSLDNMLALFLIPVVSVWSDRTRSPFGRRMPWIVTLLPLSALAFALIPWAAGRSLVALVVLLLFLNVFKQGVRGPVVALMPDTIPGAFRSQANGVINTMGNIAAIVGTIGLARLMDVDIMLPVIGRTKDVLAFPAGGLFVLLAVLLLVLFIREKHQDEPAAGEHIPFFKSFAIVFRHQDRSAVWVLVSLFLWFVGYQGVVPFITEYSIETFNLTSGQGPLSMGMVGISGALCAIPMGYAASRWGRRRVIRICLAAVSVLTVGAFLLVPAGRAAGISVSLLTLIFWSIMFLYGMFWIGVVANSFPMLWQMARYDNIGVYTGLYYTFSQLAAIVAPALSGAVIDLTGKRWMFLFCAVFFALANLTMSRVTGGEKESAPVQD